MKWALGHINPSERGEDPKYTDMQNVIHIDEKWFYLSPDTRRFYLLSSEEDPYRCEQSKRFKIKGMFMAMIGKPIFTAQGTCIHDGKYGIFPFTITRTALRRSKNREAGTEEVKPQEHVNKDVIRDMLFNNIIPVVKNYWPTNMAKDVVIQWDNATPHQIPRDPEFIQATQSDKFNIQFIFQPAQSPDLNVLDLGLFRVIQSLQYQTFPKTFLDLIEKVEEAYNEFDPLVNKYTWLTLQSCMKEILKVQGGNKYKVSHMHKRSLDNLGLLPEQLAVNKDLTQEAVQYLNLISGQDVEMQDAEF